MVNILTIAALAVAALASTANANLSPSDPRFAQQFLDAHNRVRDEHGSPHLTWSNALANEAQAYVNKCTDVHEGWEHHHHGDCLASGTPPFLTGPAHVVERFAEERNWYDYQTGKSKRPDKPIGHFAEIVWSGNKEVGCGVKYDCHNHKFPVQYVCRYSPGGNIPIQAEFVKNVKPRGSRLYSRDVNGEGSVSVQFVAPPEEAM